MLTRVSFLAAAPRPDVFLFSSSSSPHKAYKITPAELQSDSTATAAASDAATASATASATPPDALLHAVIARISVKI